MEKITHNSNNNNNNYYYKTDLGNFISYENEVDIDNNLNNYLKITSTINNTFRLQKTFKENRSKIILGLLSLLYGSEN